MKDFSVADTIEYILEKRRQEEEASANEDHRS